jgi:hypothetical protein
MTATKYTLKDCGCYVDSARGCYAIDAINNFAQAHGYQLPADTLGMLPLSDYEFANEIEDEIDDYMNTNFAVDGASWGRNENSDWGLWEYSEV